MPIMPLPEIAKSCLLLVLGFSLVMLGGSPEIARYVGWAALPVAILCAYVALEAWVLVWKFDMIWARLNASQQDQAGLPRLKSNALHLTGAASVCFLVWHLA